MSNALYKVNVGDKPMASDLDQLIDALNGAFDIGNISLAAPITAPSASGVSAAITSGTSLGVGAYKYKLTYVVGYKKSNGTYVYGNETNGSAEIDVTTTSGNQTVTLNSLPTSWPSTVVGLRVYRTAVGGTSYALVATLTAPNASYTDTTADASLGTAIPTTNTTGTRFILGVDPTSNLEAVTKQYVDNADANMAKKNVDNDFSVDQTFGGNIKAINGGFLQVGSASGTYRKFRYDGTISPDGSTWHPIAQTDVDNAFSVDQTIAGQYHFILATKGCPPNANRPVGAIGAYSNGIGVQGSTNNGADSNPVLNVLTNDAISLFKVQNGGNLFINGGYLRWNSTSGIFEFSSDGTTWKGVGGVKNVQRGTVSVTTGGSVAVTISAVDMSKTFVKLNGAAFDSHIGSGGGDAAGYWNIQLTNSTTLTVNGGNYASTVSVDWEVVESY